MLVVLGTIAPIFLIIVTGFGLRRIDPFGATTWAPLERITYYVLFPSLLFASLSAADLSTLPVGKMAAGVIGAPVVITLTLLLIRRQIGIEGAPFTSVVQGATRFNTYIGVPLVTAFFGSETMALSALFIGFMVPFINIVSVWVLGRYGDGSSIKGNTASELIRNPLILSCLAGILVNLSGLGLATPLDALFTLLGSAAPPIGLLCAGAGLDLAAARTGRTWVLVSTSLKLLAMPGIALLLALAIGLDELSTKVLVLFHALPTAPSAYILARQLGGDARLMAGILTTQTALAAVTLPLWIALLTK
ncbi:MAG: AEC family transporter [Pseudomonadota bacterium]|nr:AEC family transporter [Pseudomonadota bacterium]